MKMRVPGLGPGGLRNLLAALALAAAVFAPASAQPSPAQPAPAPTVASLQRQLAALVAQIPTVTSDDRLAALRAQANGIQAQANGLAGVQASALAKLDPQITRQRSSAASRRGAGRRQLEALLAQRAPIAQQLDQARQLATNAERAYATAAEQQRAAFNARLFEATASPLSPVFWTSLAQQLEPDLDRLQGAATEAVSTAWTAREPEALILLAVALVVGGVLVWPVRRLLERLGRRWIEDETAHRDLTLSAYALFRAVIDTVLPGLAALGLLLAARWGGLLSDEADSLGRAAVKALIWSAAVVALGRVLIAADEPGRRMLPLDDEAARRIRIYPWIVATVSAAGLLLTQLNSIIGASLAATIAANCVVSLAYAAVAGAILLVLGAVRTPLDDAQTAEDAARASTSPLVALALAAAIVVTVGAILAGYTTLAARVSGQVFWLGVLVASAYLLLRLIEEACRELFAPHGLAARALFRIFNLRASLIAQLGVLLSAVLNMLVLLGALILALTPFGRSGHALLSHAGGLDQPLHIGSVTLSPSAMVAAVASLAIGMMLVHLAQRWLNRRFLPVTDWDSGVRNSVNMGVGYLGVGVAILCALAIAGLGFQQIALVASALSVGIGFGLQQVVQNFVSGLILLVERPVKVGDWVNLGGLEGDIKNIRVRATEIRTGDNTTLIVPNSSFITATVQNKTLGNPRGQVQIKLTIAMVQDAERTRELILAAFADNKEVMRRPPPNVFIDSIAPGAVNFNCTATVASPRDAYRIRSDLYFEMLRRMLEARIIFPGGGTPSMVIEPGPTLQDLLTRASAAALTKTADADADEKLDERKGS
jgi:potassium-dependent mechanosensitive channel